MKGKIIDFNEAVKRLNHSIEESISDSEIGLDVYRQTVQSLSYAGHIIIETIKILLLFLLLMSIIGLIQGHQYFGLVFYLNAYMILSICSSAFILSENKIMHFISDI